MHLISEQEREDPHSLRIHALVVLARAASVRVHLDVHHDESDRRRLYAVEWNDNRLSVLRLYMRSLIDHLCRRSVIYPEGI